MADTTEQAATPSAASTAKSERKAKKAAPKPAKKAGRKAAAKTDAKPITNAEYVRQYADLSANEIVERAAKEGRTIPKNHVYAALSKLRKVQGAKATTAKKSVPTKRGPRKQRTSSVAKYVAPAPKAAPATAALVHVPAQASAARALVAPQIQKLERDLEVLVVELGLARAEEIIRSVRARVGQAL